MGVDLSIVIPAYNEAHKIARDLEAASSFLLSHKISGEITSLGGKVEASRPTRKARVLDV